MTQIEEAHKDREKRANQEMCVRSGAPALQENIMMKYFSFTFRAFLSPLEGQQRPKETPSHDDDQGGIIQRFIDLKTSLEV